MANDDSRVTIHMAASLDGFIARKDGSVDWLETSDEFPAGADMDPAFIEAFLKVAPEFLFHFPCQFLGISFAKLVQRDHQRSYRRIALAAMGAVCALALLSTFTLITITSRRDAEAQRSHAEGLVEFMLGDLRTRLAPEGRLATLDAVGKEALGYYAAQDPASLDADAPRAMRTRSASRRIAFRNRNQHGHSNTPNPVVS